MTLVSPVKIASVMALTPLPRSLGELDDRVRGGLPMSALLAVVERIARTPGEHRNLLVCIAPEANFKGWREWLSPNESEKAGRLASIFAMCEYVWDSETDAREFLATPHALLDGRTPLAVSMTELGARRVEELLGKLFFGIPS
ncbi:DUF2384 domain-containing protein [Paraburkholderia fungorum]|uniref:antitoxin Xre/MbcA/ParS toxin-binding domain-containing protein n=1 Tax=Paraburkholderia fungorum TaxID=134537 RepID=UPI0038B73A06